MKLAELLGYAADVAPMSVPSVLALHLAVTCALVGLIWFVQLVHYPLFAAVGEAGYPDYQRRHVRWTTVVVAPLMLVEAATAAWLAAAPPADHLAGPPGRRLRRRCPPPPRAQQLAAHRAVDGAGRAAPRRRHRDGLA